MKAKELAEKLLEHPDFEVKGIYADNISSGPWPHYNTFKVYGVADVGHSDKVIVLDLG
jgi:hypothetical protein